MFIVVEYFYLIKFIMLGLLLLYTNILFLFCTATNLLKKCLFACVLWPSMLVTILIFLTAHITIMITHLNYKLFVSIFQSYLNNYIFICCSLNLYTQDGRDTCAFWLFFFLVTCTGL